MREIRCLHIEGSTEEELLKEFNKRRESERIEDFDIISLSTKHLRRDPRVVILGKSKPPKMRLSAAFYTSPA